MKLATDQRFSTAAYILSEIFVEKVLLQQKTEVHFSTHLSQNFLFVARSALSLVPK